MDRGGVTVFVSPFWPLAKQSDVMEFVKPYKPLRIRIRKNANDELGTQMAFVDFPDETAAKAFITEKQCSRLMGFNMRVKLAFGTQSNNNNKNNNNNNKMPLQENRNVQQGCNNQASPKRRANLKPRETQPPQKEIVRGSFKIIGKVNDLKLVALETGWQSDMEKLSEGLADYSQFAKAGVDDMDPNTIYACKDPSTNKWRRCRKLGQSEGLFSVELIDCGGDLRIPRDQIIVLSQLYKDWSIKSVDLCIEGYHCENDSENNDQIAQVFLNNTFHIVYNHERTAPLMRDRIFAVEIKSNGENVLEKLCLKGVIQRKNEQTHSPLRQHPQPQQLPQPQQPSLESVNRRSPLISGQRPITKSSNILQPIIVQQTVPQQPPQQVQREIVKPVIEEVPKAEPAKSPEEVVPDSDWGEWSQQESKPVIEKQEAENGWGTVGISRDDTGTEHWVNTNNGATVPSTTAIVATTAAPSTCAWSETRSENLQENQRKVQWDTDEWEKQKPVVVVPEITKPVQKTREDVFSGASDWERSAEERKLPELHKLNIGCANCTSLTRKVQALESMVYGAATQKMINCRLNTISEDLTSIKMQITRLSMLTLQQQTKQTFDEMKKHRQMAQNFTKEVEELILMASSNTLAHYGITNWAPFVAKIWRPMLELQYFNENPISVYKNTVIRRAEIQENFPDENSEYSSEVTVILERAIESSKIYRFSLELLTHKKAANVHRVFFSEDNSKVYIILDCPPAEENLEAYGQHAVDFLLERKIVQ